MMFRNIYQSLMNLVIASVDDIDYDAMYRSNRPLATAFSFVWVFSMMMILINVFIAILLDAYTDLKEEKDEEAKKHGEKEEGFSQITKQFTSYMKRATKKLQIVKRT